MTDEEIMDNLKSEEAAEDYNRDDVDEEQKNLPSHSDDFQALDLAVGWKEWQENCDPVQLLQVKRIVIWLQGILLGNKAENSA